MSKLEDVLFDDGRLLRKIRLTTNFLERHVIPIFRLDENNNPDLFGSGVISRLDDRFYLITAAHVLDYCDKGVFLLIEGLHGKPLEGASIVTGKKHGTTRSDDKVDIGFIRLTEREINCIGADNFLDLDNISGPPMEINTTIFLVLGYPARDQIRNQLEHTIEAPLTMFMTSHAVESSYKLTNTNHNSHILLRYSRKTIATKNSIGSPPDYRGMSGGGVWPLSIFYEPLKEYPPLFAGIIIEQPRKYKSSLLVTRSNLIRAFIKRFDDN